MAETTPVLVIVAMALLLEAQVPWFVGVTVTVVPTQAFSGPPNVGILGILLIETITEDGEIQLLLLVTVNV